MLFYLFNIRPKLHHMKITSHTAGCQHGVVSQLHQQPVDAFIRKLCYKLPSVVTFTFIQTLDQNFVFFKKTAPKLARLLDAASEFALFSVSGLKDEKLIKKQTYMKTETCKLYLNTVPNFIKIKIGLHNFELYGFKVGAFFRTPCINSRRL